MDMINQVASMALAEEALRVRYVGRGFDFASVVASSTTGTLTVKLGVSNTSLAAAASAAETVFTSSGGTDLINDIYNKIRWWKTTTSGAEVFSGDWECEVLHALGNSTQDTPHHASADKFEDDAGTTNNYAGAWHDVLTWDNDAAGVYAVKYRICNPKTSKGPVQIAYITGGLAKSDGTTALDSGMRRRIFDDDGNTLYDSGTVAAATSTLDWTANPKCFNTPVIVYDSAASSGDAADVDTVTTKITWDVYRGPLG